MGDRDGGGVEIGLGGDLPGRVWAPKEIAQINDLRGSDLRGDRERERRGRILLLYLCPLLAVLGWIGVSRE